MGERGVRGRGEKWFQRQISQEKKMSKLKDKAMEEEKKEEAMKEEKKEKGEADTEKGEKGEKGRKSKRLPKPGTPGNPFRCGQGLKCPWVNGEKGPRCGLLHPESPTASLGNAAKDKMSATKADGEGNEGGMREEVQKEETEYEEEKGMGEKGEKKMDTKSANEALLKNAPLIKKGADSNTRKCFIDLLQQARPARSPWMPTGHVVGKAKSKQGQLQLQPKRKECQHMQRVKSLKKGWVFGWEGTRDGKIYQLPDNSDTGFYKLVDPLCPTPENCPCMRLTPVKLAPERKPKSTRLPKTGTKTGAKVSPTKPKKTVFGDTVVDSIQIDAQELTGLVPHAKIYSHKSGTTSPDPVRTKAANQKRAAKERRVKQAQKLKEESKERKRFLHQTERKKSKGANKQTPPSSKKKQQKGGDEKRRKKDLSSPLSNSRGGDGKGEHEDH